MPEFKVFRHRHRVTYAECTVGNHVYHSRYLDLLEEARGEFLRHVGCPLLPMQEAGIAFPVIEVHMKYHRPARYDDALSIEVRPGDLGGARLTVLHRVLRESGDLLVEAETVHVCVGANDRPKRIPGNLIEALKPWVVRMEGTRP